MDSPNDAKSRPTVSVLCATFNHASYLRSCVEGLLKQNTTFGFEIILCDDASADGTTDLVREFDAKHENVRAICHPENQYSQGFMPRDFLLPAARGKYVTWCEGDDLWTDPLKLQKQVDLLERNPDFAGCYTDFSLIDVEGNPIERPGKGKAGSVFTHLGVLRSGCPKTLTLMLRRDSIQQLIDNLVNFKGLKNGDQLFCSFATQSGDIAYIAEVTGAYRVGSGFWSTMATCAQSRNIVDSFLCIAEYFNSPEEKEAIAERVVRRLAVVALSKEEDDKRWFNSVESRMSKLGLTFDRSLYNLASKEHRRKQLRRKFRALFKVGK